MKTISKNKWELQTQWMHKITLGLASKFGRREGGRNPKEKGEGKKREIHEPLHTHKNIFEDAIITEENITVERVERQIQEGL